MLKRRTMPRNLRPCTTRIASPVPVVSNDTFGVNRHAFLSRRMPCATKFVSWTIDETTFESASRGRGPVRLHACCFVILQLAKTFPVSTPPSFTHASMMKLLICLTLAVVATTTAYVQAAEERPNELLDGAKILADIVTDKKSQYVVDGDHDHDHDNDHSHDHIYPHRVFAHPKHY